MWLETGFCYRRSRRSGRPLYEVNRRQTVNVSERNQKESESQLDASLKHTGSEESEVNG